MVNATIGRRLLGCLVTVAVVITAKSSALQRKEEEVLYPAAVLVGDLIRARMNGP